ncbi:MAG: hypothetical protein C0595_01530 [Marinilabiliales bacterium]|nr:MAG: hypothetical protein C0595_01530 [Marinilabiliales bacterium]
MKIIHLLILSLIFGNIYAQDVLDFRKSKHEIDSIRNAYFLKRIEAKSADRDSIRLLLINKNPDSLSYLYLNNYYFDELPDLSKFNRLKTIKATNNLFEKLDKKSLKSDSLKKLILEANNLRRIKFPRNSNLRSLNLSSNEFKRIPRSIRKLKNLEVLTITNNNIKRIPRFIKRMDKLKELDLSGNNIKLSKSSVKRLSNIEVILLIGNNLECLPENIGDLKSAKKINLAKNSISDLPSSFSKLSELNHIIFYKNNFSRIPPVIFKLTKLRELDFYYNNIDTIPDDIGNLKELRQLFLSYNKIKYLPSSLQNMDSLKYIYMHHNQLIMMPKWMSNMKSLQRIDFSYNNLFELADFSSLNNLVDLDLHSNNIERFPWETLELKNIKLFLIRDNPLILTQEEKLFLDNRRKSKEKIGEKFDF